MQAAGNSSIRFEYRFQLANDKALSFKIKLNAETLRIRTGIKGALPEWTQLGFKQCPNCPLDGEEHSHCPMAVSLIEPIESLSGLKSYDKAKITVTTPERTTGIRATVQEGLSAMMGLIMPASGCPHTAYFRPMARFHLPFATESETLYRVSSMYLMAQLLRREKGLEANFDLDGLNPIYENIRTINKAMVTRLSAASELDSAINAVVLLDQFAANFAYSLEDPLEAFENLFARYLQD